MIERRFEFSREGLADPPDVVAAAANHIPVASCALYMRDRITRRFPDLVLDKTPFAGRQRWALTARIGGDVFILGCCAVDEAQERWRALLRDNLNRGIFPWTRRRKAVAAGRLADTVEAVMRGDPRVADLAVTN